MTKLRGVGLTLVFAGIAAALVPALGLAGPVEVPVSGEPVAAVATTQQTATTTGTDQAQQAEDTTEPPATSSSPDKSDGKGDDNGTNINERVKRANGELRKHKLIVGGAAVGLLVIVLLGRKARSKRDSS
ncbi:MAG: hypothetical protein GEV00_08675 [Actinophytocola sp.]|nr:hypothetical protein [Actinophytocola sp.]